MSVMETLNTRRTYRRFAQKPVPQDVVDDMVEALRLSSCGGNRQAVKLRERDEGKQGGNNQQSDTDLCQRIVHLLYQVVLISNLSYTWV